MYYPSLGLIVQEMDNQNIETVCIGLPCSLNIKKFLVNVFKV